jgi:hypothetical protein
MRNGLFDSEQECRAKAAALRISAEAELSPEARTRIFEIAAEWEAKADRAGRPVTRRLEARTAVPLLFARLLRR